MRSIHMFSTGTLILALMLAGITISCSNEKLPVGVDNSRELEGAAIAPARVGDPYPIEQKLAFHVIYDGCSKHKNKGFVNRQRLHAQVDQLNKAFHAQEKAPNRSVQKRLALPVEFTLSDADIRYVDASNMQQLENLGLSPSQLSEPYRSKHAVYHYSLPNSAVREVVTRALAKDPTRYLNVYVASAGGQPGFSWYPWYDPEGSHKHAVVIHHATVPGDRSFSYPFYKQGDLLTHEIGHFYGLLHVYDGGCLQHGGGDLVDDTPPLSINIFDYKPYRDPQWLIHWRCSPDVMPPIHNYMTAAPDDMKYEFTPGQVKRMMQKLYEHKPVFMKQAPWPGYNAWLASLGADTPLSPDFPQANISVSPTRLSFGTVKKNRLATKSVALINTGTEAVTIASVTFGKKAFRFRTALPLTIPAAQSVAIRISFRPPNRGIFRSDMVFRNDATVVATATVSGRCMRR